jgi:hypothetical protein
MEQVAPVRLIVIQVGKKFIAFCGARMVTIFIYKNNITCFLMSSGA